MDSEEIGRILHASTNLYSDITNELSAQSSKVYGDDGLSLAQLDDWRTQKLPEVVAQRLANSDRNKTWLTKDELVLLVDWKLAKGKFRPTLPKLIKANTEEQVVDATRRGFSILCGGPESKIDVCWTNIEDQEMYITKIKNAFKEFTKLRGVGPATASLIASLVTKVNANPAPPFFSDESFIYFVPLQKDGSKIKYTIKEYTTDLLPAYFEILANNSLISMTDLERGGWALQMFKQHGMGALANVEQKWNTIQTGPTPRENQSKRKSLVMASLLLKRRKIKK